MLHWCSVLCSEINVPLDFLSLAAPVLGVAGDLYGQHQANKESERNREAQLAALQHGVSWRVKDAQMAGIHPLFALGAQVNQPAPIQTDFGGYSRAGDRAGELVDRAARMRHDAMAQQLIAAQIAEINSRAALNTEELLRLRRAQQGAGRLDAEARNLVFPPSVGFQTSPTSSAQRVQDEYGDVVEAIYGIGRLLYDTQRNILGPADRTTRSDIRRTPAGTRSQARGGRERIR